MYSSWAKLQSQKQQNPVNKDECRQDCKQVVLLFRPCTHNNTRGQVKGRFCKWMKRLKAQECKGGGEEQGID